ncbi:MAG: response regulator transcription factor [Ardenticatenaceae bacterium]|nr:response regulator transcription factor [Ardenticatenaceae bacterium]MCB9444148.1 response regulator transcription factor [Ardenticatenaceae bacterium]
MTFQEEPYHILVVDDSPMILRVVTMALEEADFKVTTASSGEEGLDLIQRFGLPHLALVDINMPPGMDGFEFCQKVLEFSDLPIIMLTAINHEETIIQAIDQFAEDYITKPFNSGELVSRVRRVLRRIGDFGYTNDPVIKIDQRLSIDFPNRTAVVDGADVPLTPTEAKLLYILLRSAGRTVTTDFLMRRLWPMERVGEDRLRVNIHRVRKKIEANGGVPYVISERGIGYTFAVVPTAPHTSN